MLYSTNNRKISCRIFKLLGYVLKSCTVQYPNKCDIIFPGIGKGKENRTESERREFVDKSMKGKTFLAFIGILSIFALV